MEKSRELTLISLDVSHLPWSNRSTPLEKQGFYSAITLDECARSGSLTVTPVGGISLDLNFSNYSKSGKVKPPKV